MSDIPPNPEPLRVLIVDDDPGARSQLLRCVNGEYQASCAESAAEALRKLHEEGADVVIADWLMPEASGIELCRRVRADEAIPYVYFMVITVQKAAEDRIVEAFEAGADECVSKPVSRRELLARLRAAARTVRVQKELSQRKRDVYRYNAEIAYGNRRLEEMNWKLRQAATTDDLTGLPNRRETLSQLNSLWLSADRYTYALTCMMLDIDYFKVVNDKFGHDVGDRVLVETANVLLNVTRRNETLCRIGGEEFLVLCPHAGQAEAAIGAERLRRAVETHEIRAGGGEIHVTISIGVAERTAEMHHPDDLLRAADHALYAAKAAGRNTVLVAGAAEVGTDAQRAAPPARRDSGTAGRITPLSPR